MKTGLLVHDSYIGNDEHLRIIYQRKSVNVSAAEGHLCRLEVLYTTPCSDYKYTVGIHDSVNIL